MKKRIQALRVQMTSWQGSIDYQKLVEIGGMCILFIREDEAKLKHVNERVIE